MNTVDVLVVVVVLLNAVIGAVRGFTWQAFRLGSIVLGAFFAHRFGPDVAAWTDSWLGWDPTGRRVLGYVAVFVGTYVGMSGLGYLFRRAIDKARLASADRSLGFLLGGLKGAFFVVLAFYVALMFYRVLPEDVTVQLQGDPERGVRPSKAWQLYGRHVRSHLDFVIPRNLEDDLQDGIRRAFTR